MWFLGFPAFHNAAASPAEPSNRVPLEQGLRAFFVADAAIADLVVSRVYLGRIPQALRNVTPCMTYRVISRIPALDLDGESGFVRARIQLNMVGANAIEAEALTYAVRSAINRIPDDMQGVTVAASWMDSSASSDDSLPAGSDSTRTDERIDLMIHYREQPE